MDEKTRIEKLAESTNKIIASWSEWKREYHEYKAAQRHAPDGSVYLTEEYLDKTRKAVRDA